MGSKKKKKKKQESRVGVGTIEKSRERGSVFNRRGWFSTDIETVNSGRDGVRVERILGLGKSDAGVVNCSEGQISISGVCIELNV